MKDLISQILEQVNEENGTEFETIQEAVYAGYDQNVFVSLINLLEEE